MIIYTTEDCKECLEVNAYVHVKKLENIEFKNLELRDGKYYDDDKEFPKVAGFPVLNVGETEGKPNYVVGKEGIISFLEKRYLYTIRKCPTLNTPCIETECELFTILYKGLVPEGGCSIKWNAILTTEIIKKLGEAKNVKQSDSNQDMGK